MKQKAKSAPVRPPSLSAKSKAAPGGILLVGTAPTPEPLFSHTTGQLDSFGVLWRYTSVATRQFSPPPACVILALPPSKLKSVARHLPALPIIFWPQLEGDALKNLRHAASSCGIPLARVAMGSAGGANAALLAVSFLALRYPGLRKKLILFRKKQTQTVLRHPIPGQT